MMPNLKNLNGDMEHIVGSKGGAPPGVKKLRLQRGVYEFYGVFGRVMNYPRRFGNDTKIVGPPFWHFKKFGPRLDILFFSLRIWVVTVILSY